MKAKKLVWNDVFHYHQSSAVWYETPYIKCYFQIRFGEILQVVSSKHPNIKSCEYSIAGAWGADLESSKMICQHLADQIAEQMVGDD